MRMLPAFVLCAALTLTLGLITSSSVFAQTGAGWVTGIITDQSGATVPGATVTATNQATNVTYTSIVNEAGNVAGAVISNVFKSGTNQVHGNVFEFYRNSKMDANAWANNRSNAAKPNRRQRRSSLRAIRDRGSMRRGSRRLRSHRKHGVAAIAEQDCDRRRRELRR